MSITADHIAAEATSAGRRRGQSSKIRQCDRVGASRGVC